MQRFVLRVLVSFTVLSGFGWSIGVAKAASDQGYATQPYTPRDFHLPGGAGCSGDVARWQAIQDNDYHGGNIGLVVYRKIQAEIAQAAEACSAGQDAKASALVRSSRSRHGYPQ